MKTWAFNRLISNCLHSGGDLADYKDLEITCVHLTTWKEARWAFPPHCSRHSPASQSAQRPWVTHVKARGNVWFPCLAHTGVGSHLSSRLPLLMLQYSPHTSYIVGPRTEQD